MRPRSSLPLALLLLSSCQPTADAVPPANPPTVVSPPSGGPSSTATAEAASAVELPLPAAPPGADPELVVFAGSICAAAALPDIWKKGTLRVGCRSHPPFVRPDQKPDGKLVTEMDQLDMCSIDNVYRGSFTRPGAKQAMLAFSQCKVDEASWDMGNPGSIVVVEEAGSRWKVVAHAAEVNAYGCSVYSLSDGHNAIACKNSFAALGVSGMKWFSSIDFTRPADKRVLAFGKMFFDDFPASCNPDMFPPPFLVDGVVSVQVVDFGVSDVNKDGNADIVARVQRAEVAASPALAKKARELCKKADSVQPKSYLPKATEAKLEFHGDGTKFVPTAATQKLLDAWKATAPDDGMWEMQ